jgi:outer membrane lipoprotein-sorting protein
MRKTMDLSIVYCVALGLSMAASTLAADAPLAANNDAEQLFQEMEAKLSKATALDLSFDVYIEAPPGAPGIFGVAKIKGTLAAMSGNEVRWETTSAVTSQPFKRLMISDGTKTRDTIAEYGKPVELLGGKDTDTPKNLTAELLTLVARSGLLLPQGPLPDDKADAQDRWGVSGLKLGAKEKDGERELQPLEYQLSLKGQNEPFAATVWIDLKTGLPVKRLLTMEVGPGEKITLTETYGKLVLDEKLDPKTFELPPT